jgi:hypothetical protein
MIPDMRNLLEIMRGGRPDEKPETPVMRVWECQKSIDRASKLLGIKRITHHDLRHLFATRCIESGVDIPTVSRWLGHKGRRRARNEDLRAFAERTQPADGSKGEAFKSGSGRKDRPRVRNRIWAICCKNCNKSTDRKFSKTGRSFCGIAHNGRMILDFWMVAQSALLKCFSPPPHGGFRRTPGLRQRTCLRASFDNPASTPAIVPSGEPDAITPDVKFPGPLCFYERTRNDAPPSSPSCSFYLAIEHPKLYQHCRTET